VTTDQAKQAAAEAAVALVTDGMVVGLGTGSTAKFAVDALARRVQEGLRFIGVPTSEATATQARALGIPLATLEEYPSVSLTIDGADEIEVRSLGLIKGRGGALFREKMVAAASGQLVIIADPSKIVEQLGAKAPVPVEVVPFGWQSTARRLEQLGATATLRNSFTTDGGHFILDCAFGTIADPEALARQIDSVVGVVEHGLFIGMATSAFIAIADGVQRYFRSAM